MNLVPGGHDFERAPQRCPMQILGVSLIKAVLGIETPVSIAVFDSSADCKARRIHELLRELLVERRGIAVPDVNPHEPYALICGECLDRYRATHPRIRTIGDDRNQLAISETVGPSVVGATDRAWK